MTPAVKPFHPQKRGAVLVLSMIFVVMLSILALGMATMSGMNTQIAENQRRLDGARVCAESGLEITRYWLNKVSIPGTTSPDQRLIKIAFSLQNQLSNMNIGVPSNPSTITIPAVTLNSAQGQSFSVIMKQIGDTLRVDVTGTYGTYGPVTRTIRVNYDFTTIGNTVFDFGVASRGPLSLSGNIDIEGVNTSIESNAYIESLDSLMALSITGNSHIAGNVSIVNSLAYVYLQGGKASIGDETGQAAIDNHVKIGVPLTEFPEPNPSHFEPFVTNVINSSTNTTTNATYENVRILAGTNPSFTGNVTLKGIVFIEAPNVVTFAGSTSITAVIVGDGDWTDNSGTNRISFTGNVSSLPVSSLPDGQQFAQIKNEIGTFVIAPGFQLSFGGNFTTLSGAIAANGISFHGNAGGTIDGSVINYSNGPMTLSGNSDLKFNRSGVVQVPAGFEPTIILEYNHDSYCEVVM